jgi:tetratricopeptide (TPR) repeat protein
MTEHLRATLQTTLSGSYTLERELGGGGMSRVFLAEEAKLRRKVVVKVLSPELAAGISAERFQREILTAASLQQANIVPVLSTGEAGGVPYFTMPFVEGESLRARLARTGPVSIGEAVKILGDVARALAYAHQRGIVHRDIKPDNVLLSGGTAVVTDFGIAKALVAARTDGGGSASATLTQMGTALGTPAYMAPEQAAGDPNTDHRADFYAFGGMAYELLAGRPPFVDKTPQRLLAAHMSQTPDQITTLRADVPAGLAELVMRCLAKEAGARPATASEIIAVLDAVTTTSGGSQAAMPAILLGGPGMLRKALAIYAAAFVIVAVLAKAAIVGIGLPDWVFPGSLIVMALGLPVVLWTGYVHRVARRAALATPTFTPGGSPATHGTIATMALKAAPHVSWYKTARGGMYALGAFIVMIAAFMGMRAFGIGPFGSLQATGALGAQDAVIIADFRTVNADSTLGRVLSDAVRAGLSGSSAFTLASPAAVTSALERLKLSKTALVDSSIARQIAIREGMKAVVDGEVTGVAGGYVVTLRLVRADSGTEMASFRETGDGPRGLIDAADKLSRALRAKAGESLRSVNGTPPLAQATTASLDALRKYSDGIRANLLGDGNSIRILRQAVAIDTSFAAAWNALAATLANYGNSRSAIDSAMTNAYRYRDRVSAQERDLITARYYAMGPGRDRAKAIAAYEDFLGRGITDDMRSAALVNLGEQLRGRREFARAESLNVESARRRPTAATPLGNAAELQIDQGKFDEAERTIAELSKRSPGYGANERLRLLWARGEIAEAQRVVDTLVRVSDPQTKARGFYSQASLALRGGRLRDARRAVASFDSVRSTRGLTVTREAPFILTRIDVMARGPQPGVAQRLDDAVAATPFRALPEVDRPYLGAAVAYARAGSAAKARAMLERYRAEVADTALKREQQPDVHYVLGEIALAERRPAEALTEFRAADVGADGKPANMCAKCVFADLARAFDAAGQADSAAAMFERYLATPYWMGDSWEDEPVAVPVIHERLGQLYESLGKPDKAAEHYRAFIDMWKHADPDLQPRVAAARARIEKLSPVEARRP